VSEPDRTAYRAHVPLPPGWPPVLEGLGAREASGDAPDLLFCDAASLAGVTAALASTPRPSWPLIALVDDGLPTARLAALLAAGADEHLPRDLPDAALERRLMVLLACARKRREVNLAAALTGIETLFQDIGDVFGDIVFVVNADMSQTLYVSPGLERMVGIPRAVAYTDAMAYFARVHPEDREALMGLSTATAPIEHRVAGADGRYRWVETRVEAARDADGTPLRWIGVTSDVGRRKRAEEDASALEGLLDGATLALATLLKAGDAEAAMPSVLETVGRATDAHRVYTAVHGVSDEGRPTIRFSHEWHAEGIPPIDDPALFTEREIAEGTSPVIAKLTEGRTLSVVTEQMSPSMRERIASTGARAVLMVPIVVRGTCRGHIGFVDCERARAWSTPMRRILQLTAAAIGTVALREQAEQEVATQGARLRALFEATNPVASVQAQLDALLETAVTAFHMESGVILKLDADARRCETVHAHPAGGWLQPGNVAEAPDEMLKVVRDRRARLADEPSEGVCEYGRERAVRATMTVPIHVREEPWGVLALLRRSPRPQPSNEADRDSLELLGRLVGLLLEREEWEAERRALDRRMQEAQRLESLGVLAGGVAHDFNNLLMAILGNAEVAKLDLPPGHAARESLSHIALASQRAAELTQQILAYAGKARTEREAVDVGQVVAEMGELLNAALPKNATLRIAESGGVPPIEADPAQLRQVLLNLLTNASEALGGAPGEITLSVSETDAAPAGRIGAEALDAARWVCVEVRDTGRGMTPETLERALDPFYSTREQGRGLGLAVVTGVVRGHGAVLDIDSAPGEGTRVRIYWPVASATTAAAAPVPPPVDGALRGQRVLVVDDEPLVLRAVESLLSRVGARVRVAHDGDEALSAFEAEGPFEMVILDLTMPRQHGSEVHAKLRARHAALPIVIMSGYPEDGLATDPYTAFLQKPFRPPELMERVESLLVRG